MVTLFHFWPSRITGGFAGVDVFFVISGFLITGGLFRSLASGSKLNLVRFWSGRIKRLIPAALLVSFTTVALMLALVPAELRLSTVKQFIPSSLYFENIQLQNDTVDYFAETNPSALQHYWSLSVEEQFYILWPIIIAVIAFGAWSITRKVGILKTATIALVGFSFAYGIYLTAVSPALAYFDSFTRAWEFGVGALLAVFQLRVPSKFKTPSFLLGIALLAIGSFVFTDKMHFPSWFALVPTLGAALVILARIEFGLLSNIVNWRAFQFLGNTSYSIYLWHWPVIVIATYLLGHRPGTALLVAALGLTILLAWLTKTFVEDPIRYGRFKFTSTPRTVFGTFAATVIVTLLVSAGSVNLTNGQITAHSKEISQQLSANSGLCLGAESMKSFGRDCKPVPANLRIPKNYLQVEQITPGAIWTDRCRVNLTERAIRECEFGDLKSSTSIALVGDSHAASWFPALKRVAEIRHWKLVTYYKSGCTLASGVRSDSNKEKASTCQWWETQVFKSLAAHPVNLVVVGYARASLNIKPTASESQLQANVRGLATMARKLATENVKVIGIRDNPIPGHSLRSCLIKNQDNVHKCDLKRSVAVRNPDPMELAMGQSTNFTLANFTDYFCNQTICPALVGGLYPYKDDDHAVATFVKTLIPVWDTLLVSTLSKVNY